MFKISIKKFFPKTFKKKINKILKREIKIKGSFNNWKEATSASGSYKNIEIFLRTKKSFLKVISGQAAYERDSVLFYDKKTNKPLITYLENLRKKAKSKYLKVLDFGGSFGSTYFQNKKELSNHTKFKWDVIEQKKIVDFVSKKIKLKNLRFYNSLNRYLNKNNPDLVIFSSVLHYLEFPEVILKKLIKKKIPYFLILKTPFYKNKSDIKIQLNPKYIYNVNYPIRIFNNLRFKFFFRNKNYSVTKLNWDNQIIDDIVFSSYVIKKKHAKKN